MSSYDETASPDRDPLSPAPEEAPDTVQETAPEAAGMPQEAPAEPAQDTSVPQESQRKKPSSPYENSPYSGYYDTHPQSQPKTAKHSREKSARPARQGKGKRIACAAAAALVLFGSCALTYRLAFDRAKAENDRAVTALNRQLTDLQNQIAGLNRSGGASQAGTVIPAQGLTPAQVYARNVGSVVAISCDSNMTLNGQRMSATVTGSGFILTEDGYVVTNYHVVEDATSVTVTTQSDESFEATVIGHDTTADMALLKVEAQNLQAVTLGSSSELMIGDMVVAIGNPLGTLNATQTVGYISGINRQVSTDNNYTTMLQTDAAINSGNSGGPLFNTKGEVIGITTAKYSGTSSSGASIEGIGFAIPINTAKDIVDEIIQNGYVSGRPSIGITGQNVESADGKVSGVQVYSIDSRAKAASEGLQVGDVITAVDGTPTPTMDDVNTVKEGKKAGDKLTLSVYRISTGKTLNITVMLTDAHDLEGDDPAETQQQNQSQNDNYGNYGNGYGSFGGFSSPFSSFGW